MRYQHQTIPATLTDAQAEQVIIAELRRDYRKHDELYYLTWLAGDDEAAYYHREVMNQCRADLARYGVNVN